MPDKPENRCQQTDWNKKQCMQKKQVPSPTRRGSPRSGSSDVAQQLGLEDKLALLVLLRRLKGLVVLPADRLLALVARDVADDVAAGGHVALIGVAGVDVDDAVEEVGLAVLAAEVLSLLLVCSSWR